MEDNNSFTSMGMIMNGGFYRRSKPQELSRIAPSFPKGGGEPGAQLLPRGGGLSGALTVTSLSTGRYSLGGPME
jgi:hypothetical protein